MRRRPAAPWPGASSATTSWSAPASAGHGVPRPAGLGEAVHQDEPGHDTVTTYRRRSPPPSSTSGCGAACDTPWSRPAPARRRWRWRWAATTGSTVHVHHDERAAAFIALGIGLATGVPAVVLTTSGTAAAELHPAVVEAHQARVPLLVCTADRPPELQAVGAPQTIDQTHLYGRAVRWFAEPGVADDADARHVALARRPGRSPRRRGRRPARSTSTWRSATRSSASPATCPPGRPDGGLVARQRAPRASTAPRDRGVAGDRRRRRRVRPTSIGCDVAGARRPARRGCGCPAPIGAFDALLRTGAMPGPRSWCASATRRRRRCWRSGWRRSTSRSTSFGPALVDPDRTASTVCATACRCSTARATTEWLRARGATPRRAAQRAIDDVLAAQAERHRAGRGPRRRRPRGDARGVVVDAGPRRRVVRRAARRAAGARQPRRQRHRRRRVDRGRRRARHRRAGHGARRRRRLPPRHQRAARAAPTREVDLTIVVVDNDGGGIFSFLPQATELDAERFEPLFGTPHDVDLGDARRAPTASRRSTVDEPDELAGALAASRPGASCWCRPTVRPTSPCTTSCTPPWRPRVRPRG